MKQMVVFFYPFIKKYKKEYAFGAFIIFFLSILVLPTPFIMRVILDSVIPNKNYYNLFLFGAIILMSMLLQVIFNYLKSVYFFSINGRIMIKLKAMLLGKINRIDIEDIQSYGSGYLMSRVNDDVENIQTFLGESIISFIKDIMTLIICITAIFYLNVFIGFIIIILYPIFILIIIKHSMRINKKAMVYYESNSVMNSKLEEAIRSIETIKSFSRYNYNIIKFLKYYNSFFRQGIILMKETQLNGMIVNFVNGMIPVLIILISGFLIMQGTFSIGSFLATNSFNLILFGAFMSLMTLSSKVQTSLPAFNRIIEILNFKDSISIIDSKLKEKNILYDNIDTVEFKNIIFNYKKIESAVLNINSFKIEKGDRIGLVGNSGEGKTTFLKVLLGIYKSEKMEILINNNSIESGIFQKYKIAIVEQEPFLFNDTIFNNIKFGNINASEKDVEDAARQANCMEFIASLPNGIKTEVGDRGSSFSIGQKQRIAIARALIKKPTILLLDEATSNLDVKSEKYITDIIYNLPQDIVVIFASHRLDCLIKSTKVFEIKNSKINLVKNLSDYINEKKRG